MKQASQTMKIRPVFDALARDKSQPLYPIGLSSDIEKAFFQLSIIPEHRDYLRFFLPNVEEFKIYRHCRVVFGICSSPFQLSACIDHLLENSPARFDDVTQKLKHLFYVDNCVTGVTDIKEQESFINKAIEVMARGCFNLRGWESNVPGRYIFRSSGVTSLLGLLWDLDQDTLKCNLNYSGEVLQEAWELKLKWDDPLPENIQKIFRKWRDEIVYLEKVNIPRYVEINENSELHLFVDACKSSYGVCVYIRTVTPLGVKIRLIRAKSRVAPLKTMTIPRLELMDCCIGVRLVHSVYAALYVPDLKIIAWSDSMVALWWLKSHGDWSVFVANRIKEINSLVPSQFWRHVAGELNPADLLSRGISPRLFSDSLWWEGPSCLLEPPSNWPIDRLACETSEVERKKRKVRLCNLVAVEGEIPCEPVSLPGDRVNDAAVFEVVGVDLAGPLYVKGGQKSWIVLFTCATYRAVHLELTSSLSTDAFLLSLRRFIARRGDHEPLTYLSENSDDLVPLSPAMFLVENRNLDVPDIDYRDTVNLRKKGHSADSWKGWQDQNCGTEDSHWNNVTTHSTSLSLGSAVDRNPNDPLNDCTITNPISSISSDNLFQILTTPVMSCLEYPSMEESSKYQRNWTSSTRCYMFLSPSDVDSKKGEDVEGHRNELFR
ncbi:integrase catalytic domain-containing protein [Trichonephila clavipes]|nr:integrase catalytic domain-containing protein [Trichonephila clavipes]